VFVIWLAEGRFPSFRTDDEEEERRLFYVAVTRARDRLFLVRPQIARDRYRVDTILDPSRFLSELPAAVRESVAVTEDRAPDGIDELPGEGRYNLPAFLEEPSEDDVN
jgi:DNA helicase-2/ATP-dependent DNA helicase PcrA